MRSVYSNKYFGWVLIVVMLFYLANSILILNKSVTQASTIYGVVFILFSALGIISLLLKSKLANRVAQLFIIIVLVSPPVFIIKEYLSNLLFYGINRTELLQNYLMFTQLIVGVILFLLTLKYSSDLN